MTAMVRSINRSASQKTLEEREAAYAEARQRIFGSGNLPPKSAESDSVSFSETPAVVTSK